MPARWIETWDRASPRERRFAVAAAAVVVLAAAWWLVWQPVQDDSQRARRDLLSARAVLANARTQVNELTGLQRAPANPASGDARVAVERVLGERGLKSSLTSLEAKDNRIALTFAAVGFDALVGALEAMARDSGLRPVEATLTSRVDPGTVRADIVLAR